MKRQNCYITCEELCGAVLFNPGSAEPRGFANYLMSSLKKGINSTIQSVWVPPNDHQLSRGSSICKRLKNTGVESYKDENKMLDRLSAKYIVEMGQFFKMSQFCASSIPSNLKCHLQCLSLHAAVVVAVVVVVVVEHKSFKILVLLYFTSIQVSGY